MATSTGRLYTTVHSRSSSDKTSRSIYLAHADKVPSSAASEIPALWVHGIYQVDIFALGIDMVAAGLPPFEQCASSVYLGMVIVS